MAQGFMIDVLNLVIDDLGNNEVQYMDLKDSHIDL